jgi:hypothetical protein
VGQSKEPVIERITSLVRHYPSRSAAARAWGVNVNTLKSYYRKEGAIPEPRDNLLARIAESEGVSFEWLKYGTGEQPQGGHSGEVKSPISTTPGDELIQILGFLTVAERKQLATMLARKGVETVLYLLDEDNIKLLKMDRVMKEKVLGLQPQTLEEAARVDEEARECGANNEGETLPQSLASNDKRAG